jgi:hypothetical protein
MSEIEKNSRIKLISVHHKDFGNLTSKQNKLRYH